MDREEKLKAAKEKLKQFQKKRQKDSTLASSSIDESSSTSSSPFPADQHQHHEPARREKSSGELAVFTMGDHDSSLVATSNFSPSVFDNFVSTDSATSFAQVNLSQTSQFENVTSSADPLHFIVSQTDKSQLNEASPFGTSYVDALPSYNDVQYGADLSQRNVPPDVVEEQTVSTFPSSNYFGQPLSSASSDHFHLSNQNVDQFGRKIEEFNQFGQNGNQSVDQSKSVDLTVDPLRVFNPNAERDEVVRNHLEQQEVQQMFDKVDENLALKGQIEDLLQAKEDLERQLLLQAASVKQYDVYCQSLVSELTTCQANLDKERRDLKQALDKDRKDLETESGSLRSQLQSHADSIKILVAEKADFEATVRKLHSELANKSAELTRIHQEQDSETSAARLENLRLQIQTDIEAKMGLELEGLRHELSQSRQLTDDLQQEVAELNSKVSSKDKSIETLSAELKLKTSKLEMAELNLAQLRTVERDVDEGKQEEAEKLAEKEAEVARLTTENSEHLQRVSELTAYIHQASVDREQIIHQYTSYSQQLATQIESLTHQLNDKSQENHMMASREKDLLLHVQQLEAQLQKLIQGDAHTKAAEVNFDEVSLLRERVVQLTENLLELQRENEQLKEVGRQQNDRLIEVTSSLSSKEEALSELETQLEMVKSAGSVDVSHLDLMAACQSDKVAASRAMIQNKQLKDQVEELESAVVQLTNNKADLMNDLDTMKSAQTKLEKDENTMKMEIRGLHAALAERDRNLNHMREQMKYYIAFAENSIEGHLESGPRKPTGDQEQIRELIAKLQNAQEEIRCLNSHNSELRSQLEVLSSRTRDSSETPDLRNDDSADTTPPPPGQTPSISDSPRPPPSPTPSTTSSSASPSPTSSPNASPNHVTSALQEHQNPHENELQSLPNYNSSNNNNNKGPSSQRPTDSIPPLSRDVALLKLEQKFKQAMQRIEELLSEKEHLEHVVVQLQEETNTVGEYITIYQYQRQQQRKHLEEKERQLQIVSRDREDLKAKLSQLQHLVTSFVQDGPKVDNHSVPQQLQQQRRRQELQQNVERVGPQLNGAASSDNGDYEESEDALSAGTESPQTGDSSQSTIPSRRVADVDPTAPVIVETTTGRKPKPEHVTSPTKADKILALISEIGANQMLSNLEDFQPWFWEHSPGKLINI